MIPHSSSSVRITDFAFIKKIALRNFVGQGRMCQRFEENLRKACKRESSILVNSGSAALELALHVLRQRWPRRKYVAVSSYVCPAVVSSIVRSDLKPLFMDIQLDSMNLDTVKLQQRADDRILAALYTNIAGMPDDYHNVADLPCAIISDCAQGFGATWEGQPLASLGHLAILSFAPTKMLTAGTGGALLMNDPTLSSWASRQAAKELEVAFYQRQGFEATNGQFFSDLNAGLGLAQLQRLSNFLIKRRAIAAKYTAVLRDRRDISLPRAPSVAVSSFYRYYFLTDKATAWLQHLRGAGIDARPSISHDMSIYHKNLAAMPNLKHNRSRLVSLPIYPSLLLSDVHHVVKVLKHGTELGL